MDFIRTFSEVAFSKVAKRFLSARKRRLASSGHFHYFDWLFPLDSDTFLDQARICHPELSDDRLKLLYRLAKDDWSRFGFAPDSIEKGNIFLIIAFMADMMLDERDNWPTVHFKDLFRWREITQLLGEDIMTCAKLAFTDRHNPDIKRRFDWPSVAHNDNPNLNYLFRTKRLCELHSHLKASTNTFEISWVSLMNHISGLDVAFKDLSDIQEPSLTGLLNDELYDFVKMAARLRWDIYNALIRASNYSGFSFKSENIEPDELDSQTYLERSAVSNDWIPDYIRSAMESPMNVYAGERLLVYSVLRRIYSSNDAQLTRYFYSYVLIKNLLRSYLVQTNNNIGFSNFQRYQNLKSRFLAKGYQSLLESMPLWEAKNHNFTQIFESRIVPVKSKRDFLRRAGILNKWNMKKDAIGNPDLREALSNKEWLLIFHFIKQRHQEQNSHIRDRKVRKENLTQSRNLSDVSHLLNAEGIDAGIDAASSEFNCRPEVYGQAFRFLRHYGLDATFHAGEDFYDIADGLRAIDEAVRFLQLRAADRIGHALALGVDAGKYYRDNHRLAALPKQWMLDNVVWLLMKSRQFGIDIDSRTEWFLENTYKELAHDIGYSRSSVDNSSDETDILIPDISDYWNSMMLRGDNPELYEANGTLMKESDPSPDEWDHYALLNSEKENFIRRTNKEARKLYSIYHASSTIRSKGEEVKAFELPEGYPRMITALQDALIKDISKRQICIECCPSSNVRIGRLDRFENHPIFRLAPINPSDTRHPLSVTVNTDDLGVFATSLPNEYSLLTLALLKKTDSEGRHLFSTQEVYDWIGRLIDNGYKFTFMNQLNSIKAL